MENQFARTELLIGSEGIQKLKQASVAVFGIGGVGSFVVEGLARAGVEHFILVDKDCVSLTNLNRQLIALHSTIGRAKTEIAKERILDINPKAEVKEFRVFYPENGEEIFQNKIDYMVDAIDTVSSKLDLISKAKALEIPILSCMGTGNKLNPMQFEIADISKTSVCPLAKVMRKELRKRGIQHLKVLYSKEEPLKKLVEEENVFHKHIPGSISFVPPVAGFMIAGEVVKDLIK